jgi:hypothetical protein
MAVTHHRWPAMTQQRRTASRKGFPDPTALLLLSTWRLRLPIVIAASAVISAVPEIEREARRGVIRDREAPCAKAKVRVLRYHMNVAPPGTGQRKMSSFRGPPSERRVTVRVNPLF